MRHIALEAGAFEAQVNEGFERGGAGAADLAEAVVEACEQPNDFHHLYPDEAPIRDKIKAIATRVYGQRSVARRHAAEQPFRRRARRALCEIRIYAVEAYRRIRRDAPVAH